MSEFDLLSVASDGMSMQRALLDVAARNVAAEDGDSDGRETRLVATVPNGETADALTEMIAVLDAQRAYEANASVFDAGKKLAERTLDVGRG